MTLINLFRRYERWNPVHPTYGAFWGIGLGLGCGVGWGPGFGPEVIGYVGSGCGVGLSVGVTTLGIGVGLPAGGLVCIPSDVVSYAGNGLMGFTKSTAAPAAALAMKQGWSALSWHVGRVFEQVCRKQQCNIGDGWSSWNAKLRSAGSSRFRGLKAAPGSEASEASGTNSTRS